MIRRFNIEYTCKTKDCKNSTGLNGFSHKPYTNSEVSKMLSEALEMAGWKNEDTCDECKTDDSIDRIVGGADRLLTQQNS